MALYASKSCLKYVPTQNKETSACITNCIVKGMLKSSSVSLNLRISLLRQISTTLLLQCDRILLRAATTIIDAFIAGALGEVNCKDSIHYDIVTKKNTEICDLSVFKMVCYTLNVVIWSIAHRLKQINVFAERYV